MSVAGWIYVLDNGMGHYKIGKAKVLDRRIKQLKVLLPFQVTVAYTFYCDDYSKVEREMHQHFSERRLNGEWFALDTDDFARIQQYSEFQGWWEDGRGQWQRDVFAPTPTEAETLALASYDLDIDHARARRCKYWPIGVNVESHQDIWEVAEGEDAADEAEQAYYDDEYREYLADCEREEWENPQVYDERRRQMRENPCEYYSEHVEGCPHDRRFSA